MQRLTTIDSGSKPGLIELDADDSPTAQTSELNRSRPAFLGHTVARKYVGEGA